MDDKEFLISKSKELEDKVLFKLSSFIENTELGQKVKDHPLLREVFVVAYTSGVFDSIQEQLEK